MGTAGDIHIPPSFFCLLFKKQKKYKSITYTKIKFYITLIDFFFLRMNNKKCTKKGPLLFLYKLSIVVLIDLIAILLTPGIFLIQIVDINMYLIHFYIKNNIKMHFSRVELIKFQNRFRHSLSIPTR